MPGYGQAPASGDNQEKKIRGQAASFAGMGLCCPKRTGLLQMEKAFSCKGGGCVDVSMRGDEVTVKFCCLSHRLPLSERFSKHFLRLFPAKTYRALPTLQMINFVLLQMQNRTASCMETLKSSAMINMLTWNTKCQDCTSNKWKSNSSCLFRDFGILLLCGRCKTITDKQQDRGEKLWQRQL